MINTLKRQTIFGLIWKFLERVGSQGISFVVSLVLARLLMPSDYGVIAMITIFISLANVFAQCGLGTALIQRRDIENDDFSSVLVLSCMIAIVIYCLLFISAPYIAGFYGMPILSPVLRVLALKVLIAPFTSVQESIVSRNMQFKKLFYSSLGAALPSGVIGIVMAGLGFGVWALVAQQLSEAFFMFVIMWVTVRWRPRLVFRVKRVKVLFSYGWKILLSKLIDTLYLNIRSLIIGKLYSSDMLGFYDKGWQFPAFITTNIDGSIQSVMLPVLSKVQEQKQQAKAIMRRSITLSSFLMFPLMAGLAACAKPLITLVLTDKWLPCVPFLQIGCAVFATQPIHTANLQAINAMGRSDIFLKLEIIKKIFGLAVIAVTAPMGVYAIALGSVFAGVVSTLINAFPNKRILNYGYIEQIKDLLPSLFNALIMFLGIIFITKLQFSPLLILIIQVIL